MIKKFIFLLGFIPGTFLPLLRADTVISGLDRYEIIQVTTPEDVLIKINKFTGKTFAFSARSDREETWTEIKYDKDPQKNLEEKINFQIITARNLTILYNVHTGKGWYLDRGPLGYDLLWKKLKDE